MRHTLPSGGWVVLRDHTKLRAKTLKKVMRSVTIDDASALNTGLSITDALLTTLVTGWELPYEPEPDDNGNPVSWVLPSQDVAIVDELTTEDYTKLRDLIQPAQKAMFPGKPNPDEHADPASPTEPASA
jgi:hypothetical protein